MGQYGWSKPTLVKFLMFFSWVIPFVKKYNKHPVWKWLFYPIFMRPYTELSNIPLNIEVESQGKSAMPRRIIKRLLTELDDKFVFDKCLCREGRNDKYQDIGCFCLGPAAKRLHPSHGRFVTTEEALKHLDRAAEAGLVACFAHAWIDPLMFGTRFKDLMFICLCDNECGYRADLKVRGPALEGVYQKLPGLSIVMDEEKCVGCGTCVEACFLGNISVVDGKAKHGPSCSGCGKCVEVCPNKAVTMNIVDEEVLYQQLVKWIKGVSELPVKNS